MLALARGIAIILTVLSLNVFENKLQNTLNPHAKIKMKH